METSTETATVTETETTETDNPKEKDPNLAGRIKDLMVVKPIIIGNTAKYFGKREADNHTHEWTVYVKPYFSNEDYSSFIKKVHFKLHETYQNPVRVVSEPPFEVSETGWGEFQIVIRIHFQDPTEAPVTCYHILRLFDYENGSIVPIVSNFVRSESTDEIVFREPTVLMKTCLDNVKTQGRRTAHNTNFEALRKASEAEITAARKAVQREIQDAKFKLILAGETIEKFKEKLKASKEE